MSAVSSILLGAQHDVEAVARCSSELAAHMPRARCELDNADVDDADERKRRARAKDLFALGCIVAQLFLGVCVCVCARVQLSSAVF